MAFAVIYALLGAVFFTIESMFNRYLDLKGIPGNISGLCYLFFEGIIGTICLIVYSCFGHGIYDFTPILLLLVLGAGLFTTFGLILQNYALSVGVAGIVISIVNSAISIQAQAATSMLTKFSKNGLEMQ